MSFQYNYGTNDNTFIPHNVGSFNSSSNTGNKRFTDEDKKKIINNLEQFTQGFQKLTEYMEYIDTEKDTKTFRSRLYVLKILSYVFQIINLIKGMSM